MPIVLCSFAAMAVGYLRARMERTYYVSDLDVSDFVFNGLIIGLLAFGVFWLATSGIH